MSTLDSRFSREDLETLIEAMGDWESLGNHEFHVLQMVKNIPMPPEDHEAYEFIQKLKEHFRSREREINDSRRDRQEQAVLLKAKLMLARKDLDIEQVFDMAANIDTSYKPSDAPREAGQPSEVGESNKALEDAEFFIKDLGVWDHYQTFLKDRREKTE